MTGGGQPLTLSLSLWERERQKSRRGLFEGSFTNWEKDRMGYGLRSV